MIDSHPAIQALQRTAPAVTRGGKLYHPGTTDEFTLNDFPHATADT